MKPAYGSQSERCKIAWATLMLQLTLSVKDVAQSVGVKRATLADWINRYHPRELSERRAELLVTQRPKSAGVPISLHVESPFCSNLGFVEEGK